MQTEFERQVRETNERLTERTGRPLLTAILIGLVLGGGLLVSLLFFKELFMVFAAVLIGFTTYELATALRTAGRDVPRVASIVAGIAIIPASVLLAGRRPLVRDPRRDRRSSRSGAWSSCVRPSHRTSARAVLAGSRRGRAHPALRGLHGHVRRAAHRAGRRPVVVPRVPHRRGRGRHRRVRQRTARSASTRWRPNISPKKTWEGFAGAALVAIVAGVLLAIFMLQQPWWVGVILGVVMLFTGTAGDLAESLIKRDLGVKDMSTWLPGPRRVPGPARLDSAVRGRRLRDVPHLHLRQ